MQNIDMTKLNEYFYRISQYRNLYYEHIDFFYRVALFAHNLYKETDLDVEEFTNLEYVGILENIELIKEFYKENNIEVDIDKLVSDGTIGFVELEDKLQSIGRGLSHKENGFALVDVWKHGNLIDGVILLHEISHNRDISMRGANQIRDMFTETLAYAEERIYVDWLEEKGYKGIKKAYDKLMNVLNYVCEKNSYYNLKIYNLFKEIGSIDKESYDFFYNDNSDYNEVISNFKNDNDLFSYCWNAFGVASSMYIYDRYKKGEITLQDINRYHESIQKDLYTACEDLGLTNILSDNIEDIVKALEDNYIDYDEELVMKH